MATLRIRLTKDQWLAIIEEQARSGQTIRAFCKERDIGLASFCKWKKIAQEKSDKVSPQISPVDVVDDSQSAANTSSKKTAVTLIVRPSVTLTIQTGLA